MKERTGGRTGEADVDGAEVGAQGDKTLRTTAKVLETVKSRVPTLNQLGAI